MIGTIVVNLTTIVPIEGIKTEREKKKVAGRRKLEEKMLEKVVGER